MFLLQDGNIMIRNGKTTLNMAMRLENQRADLLLPSLQWDVTRTGAKSQSANGDKLISSHPPDLQFLLHSNLTPNTEMLS